MTKPPTEVTPLSRRGDYFSPERADYQHSLDVLVAKVVTLLKSARTPRAADHDNEVEPRHLSTEQLYHQLRQAGGDLQQVIIELKTLSSLTTKHIWQVARQAGFASRQPTIPDRNARLVTQSLSRTLAVLEEKLLAVAATLPDQSPPPRTSSSTVKKLLGAVANVLVGASLVLGADQDWWAVDEASPRPGEAASLHLGNSPSAAETTQSEGQAMSIDKQLTQLRQVSKRVAAVDALLAEVRRRQNSQSLTTQRQIQEVEPQLSNLWGVSGLRIGDRDEGSNLDGSTSKRQEIQAQLPPTPVPVYVYAEGNLTIAENTNGLSQTSAQRAFDIVNDALNLEGIELNREQTVVVLPGVLTPLPSGGNVVRPATLEDFPLPAIVANYEQGHVHFVPNNSEMHYDILRNTSLWQAVGFRGINGTYVPGIDRDDPRTPDIGFAVDQEGKIIAFNFNNDRLPENNLAFGSVEDNSENLIFESNYEFKYDPESHDWIDRATMINNNLPEEFFATYQDQIGDSITINLEQETYQRVNQVTGAIQYWRPDMTEDPNNIEGGWYETAASFITSNNNTRISIEFSQNGYTTGEGTIYRNAAFTELLISRLDNYITEFLPELRNQNIVLSFASGNVTTENHRQRGFAEAIVWQGSPNVVISWAPARTAGKIIFLKVYARGAGEFFSPSEVADEVLLSDIVQDSFRRAAGRTFGNALHQRSRRFLQPNHFPAVSFTQSDLLINLDQ